MTSGNRRPASPAEVRVITGRICEVFTPLADANDYLALLSLDDAQWPALRGPVQSLLGKVHQLRNAIDQAAGKPGGESTGAAA